MAVCEKYAHLPPLMCWSTNTCGLTPGMSWKPSGEPPGSSPPLPGRCPSGLSNKGRGDRENLLSLEIIGEAAYQVSSETRSRVPEIPWEGTGTGGRRPPDHAPEALGVRPGMTMGRQRGGTGRGCRPGYPEYPL